MCCDTGDENATRRCVVHIDYSNSRITRDGLAVLVSIGVASHYGNNFAHLCFKQGERIANGALDNLAVRLPLVADLAQAI